MNADEARRKAQRAEAAAARKQAKEREAEAKRHKADVAKYMRKEYPRFKADIQKQIREASSHGQKNIKVVDPPSHAWDALEKELRANGYSIVANFNHGEYENMGDFNAPCNIWREPYWSYKVGW